MSDQSLRAAIAAELAILGPGIGKVHDYERWANNPADLLKLFQVEDKIFGWEIVRNGFKISRGKAMNTWAITHKYVLRGYYGLKDSAATEKTVNAIVDLIVMHLAASSLDGASRDLLPEAKVETRAFGSILCHVAEITFDLSESVSRNQIDEEAGDLLAIGLNYYLKPGDDVADASDLVTLAGTVAELDGEDATL